MLIASIFFSIMSAGIKYIAPKVGFFDVIFYRLLINLIITTLLIKIKGLDFRTDKFRLHFIRSAIGNLAMYSGFYALMNLPIGTATTLGYTNPIFQSIISYTTRKDKLNYYLISSVIIGFAGIIILQHPNIPDRKSLASLTGLLAGLFTALAYFNVGKLVQTGEPELRVVFYFSLIGTLFSGGILTLIGFTKLDSISAIIICAIGLFGSIGQITMTFAYGHGNTIIVSIISYSTIIFSTLIGYFIFNEQLTLTSFTGMILIILSGAIVIFKRPSNRKKIVTAAG